MPTQWLDPMSQQWDASCLTRGRWVSRCAQTAIDLVRLNAVQPSMVPPLATGYKVIDLDANLAADLKRWNRDALDRCAPLPGPATSAFTPTPRVGTRLS
jgi:hypothetical protein